MARPRGIRLDRINRAEFEALEERVETRELARHLARFDPDYDDHEEPQDD